jgi:hypothetical protein
LRFCISHRLSSIAYCLLPIIYRLSFIAYRPSTIDHWSLIIDHPRSMINDQWSVLHEPPFVRCSILRFSPMITRAIHLDLVDDYDIRFNKFVSRISRSLCSEMRNDKQQWTKRKTQNMKLIEYKGWIEHNKNNWRNESKIRGSKYKKWQKEKNRQE